MINSIETTALRMMHYWSDEVATGSTDDDDDAAIDSASVGTHRRGRSEAPTLMEHQIDKCVKMYRKDDMSRGYLV
jgi:hypothetical protein